jgi:hypothetical protein
MECPAKRIPSPSILARKILCSACQIADFPAGVEGELLRGRHAVAMLCVIRRHLKAGYQLLAVEEYEDGNED